MCSRLEPSAPPAFTSPGLLLQPNIPPLAGSQGHPTRQWRFQRSGAGEGYYVQEHVLSTLQSSHLFRLVAAGISLNGQRISKRQEGGSGKGTQLPLITAQQPSLPQNACSVGEVPAAAASPPGARAAPALFGAPTFAGNPPSPAVPLRLRRGRRALSPAASRSGARSPTFPRVQPVTRSPISWWILLKRQRSRSRTKAIVLFPPLDSASLPECPFIYDYSHCLCARAGGEPLCSSVYLRDGAGEGGRRFIKTCLVVSGAPA